MATKLKKPKKTREVSGTLHTLVSAKKHVYGQLRGAATHSPQESLDKHSMGVKPCLAIRTAAFAVRWSAVVIQARARWQQYLADTS